MDLNNNKRRSILLIFFMCSLIYMSFTSSVEPKFKLYTGANLTIGIVGEVPHIREKNIDFRSVTIEEYQDGYNLEGLHAMIFMESEFQELDEGKYKDEILNLRVPIVFVNSNASYLPFVYDDMIYDPNKENSSQMYFSMIYKDNEKMQNWECGLYNDNKSQEHIEAAYSLLFEEISKKYKSYK